MGLFSFSNHLTNHHFLEIFSSRCPKDAGPGGRLGGGRVGFGGGGLPHLGSVLPPCSPRKEVLHLELCVLIPPQTVQTWIAGKQPQTGSPSRSPIPEGPAPATGGIFRVTD